MNNILFHFSLVTFLASFLIWLMFLALLGIFNFKKGADRKQLFFILLVSLLSWALAEAVKKFLPIPRPFQVNGFLPLTFTHPTDSSFPSGHAAAAFGLVTGLFLTKRKTGIFFFFPASLVAVGRVLSNVHYPVDVLGGATLGIFTALLLESVFPSLKQSSSRQ